jgi:Fic family protein
MKASDFRSESAGRVVPTLKGQPAFVPAPLPPDLVYDSHLVLKLSHADAALSELSGLGRHLPNPHLLIAPYVRREAILSSRIEGTRANLSDLLRDEAREAPQHEDADIREVRNYIDALEYGMETLPQLPLSLRLVREMHKRLLAGVRGQNARLGEFRDEQNWIGADKSDIAEAHFVPPPPTEMHEALNKWERFMNERDMMPELIQCALIHQQFETIHPFIDGNGRLGRLLIILFLIERGRLSQPLLYLSAYFEAHRQDYYDLLQRVRTDGDWSSWLRFFLDGVTETAQAAVRQAGELMDLRERYREQLHDKPRALALLDKLFVNPYVTASRAATQLHVSLPVARQAIATLEQQGMLTEITGRSWGRTYVALPILRAIAPDEVDGDRNLKDAG